MAAEFLYLASASPRRRELLDQIGVPHRVRPADVDEGRRTAEPPGDYVLRVAGSKAEAIWAALADGDKAPVLAADTTVTIDGDVLGKPRDEADATAMLKRLSGRTHEVLTAVALRDAHGLHLRLSQSAVRFRRLVTEEIRRYWLTGEPRDKAGAYAIQGYAAVFVEHIAGSYSGVMGLPLFETAELLRDTGILDER